MNSSSSAITASELPGGFHRVPPDIDRDATWQAGNEPAQTRARRRPRTGSTECDASGALLATFDALQARSPR